MKREGERNSRTQRPKKLSFFFLNIYNKIVYINEQVENILFSMGSEIYERKHEDSCPR